MNVDTVTVHSVHSNRESAVRLRKITQILSFRIRCVIIQQDNMPDFCAMAASCNGQESWRNVVLAARGLPLFGWCRERVRGQYAGR